MISKGEIINVLNYNDNSVCIKTRLKEYLCPQRENGQPSVTPLEFSEIEELNSASPCFKMGLLFFEESRQEEVYESLRIADWKDILKNEDIRDIILNPTYENMSKILKIENVAYFERVRGVLNSLQNSGEYDISIRVARIIDERYKEIRSRKYKTRIVLSQKTHSSGYSADEIAAIRNENKVLKSQLDKMQESMNLILAKVNLSGNVNEAEKEASKTGEVSETVKPAAMRGRPKKAD